jgi:hypothetical protein
LERNDATPGEIESHREKAGALQVAMKLPDERTAVDVLELTVALTTAWAGVPEGLRTVGELDPQARKDAHRAVVVQAVAALCDAMTDPEESRQLT